MAFQVTSKTAIVTGAGSGINYSFAKLLLENDCNVILADLALRPEAIELIDKHSDEGKSPRAIFVKTDVKEWEQLERLFVAAEDHFGHADIVCPGAGVHDPPFSSFWVPTGTQPSRDSPHGNRYASFDINLSHPVRCTQLAISHFIEHKTAGSVVLVSSIAAQMARIQCPLYVACKHGISGFARSLSKLEEPATEGVPPVRVTAVAPGIVKTALWLENKERLEWIDQDKDSWITPEQVADVMLSLIQEEEYHGGTVLEVGAESVRRVNELNDPGPSGAGFTLSQGKKSADDIWSKLSSGSWGQ